MELLGPTWRQRLSYGACAIAVVCTLSVYKSSLGANSLSADQKQKEVKEANTSRYAITAANLERLTNRYSNDTVVKFSKAPTKE